MNEPIETPEEILQRFIPCMCQFKQGFAWRKGTPCTCGQAEAKAAIEAYALKRELEARIDELRVLKQEYHDNMVSDDRMDMEIDDRIAELTKLKENN